MLRESTKKKLEWLSDKWLDAFKWYKIMKLTRVNWKLKTKSGKKRRNTTLIFKLDQIWDLYKLPKIVLFNLFILLKVSFLVCTQMQYYTLYMILWKMILIISRNSDIYNHFSKLKKFSQGKAFTIYNMSTLLIMESHLM